MAKSFKERLTALLEEQEALLNELNQRIIHATDIEDAVQELSEQTRHLKDMLQERSQ